MKKSIHLTLAISFCILLMSAVIINFIERKTMNDALGQLESMERANLVVFEDALSKELIRYDGDEAKEQVKDLLPVSTLGKKYHQMVKNATTELYVRVLFYDNSLLLGEYEIYKVNEGAVIEDVKDKVLYINQTPSFIYFNDRYWTLSQAIDIGEQ